MLVKFVFCALSRSHNVPYLYLYHIEYYRSVTTASRMFVSISYQCKPGGCSPQNFNFETIDLVEHGRFAQPL